MSLKDDNNNTYMIVRNRIQANWFGVLDILLIYQTSIYN